MREIHPSSHWRLAAEQYAEAVIAAIVPFAATCLIWPFVDLAQHGFDWQGRYEHPDYVWVVGAGATLVLMLVWPLVLSRSRRPVTAAVIAGALTGLAAGLATGAAYFAVGGRP